uniref:Uncharacterized protein n=1 Tax=Ascaris lumbricoides TaxID=6252 RepID=A0A0M3I4V0_ASCLU
MSDRSDILAANFRFGTFFRNAELQGPGVTPLILKSFDFCGKSMILEKYRNIGQIVINVAQNRCHQQNTEKLRVSR